MKYISKFKSVPSLRKGVIKQSGRNNIGKITVRHHGGGHKQAFRSLDWARSETNTVVVGFEYDPIRTASLVKLYTNESVDTKYSYIIAPSGAARFQTLTKYNLSGGRKDMSTNSPTYKLLKPGDAAPISFFEVGDFLHSLEAFPGQGSLFSRASGSYCQIRSINQSEDGFLKTKETEKSVIVRLPSGKKRSISINAQATLGRVHQDTKTKRNMEKAGRIRWLGWRPSVRGVAINPVDHPHGGGQGKTSGGRPSVTFKSWPTKGQPTRSPKRKSKFILKS